jgi:hypothetical protein
MPDPFLHIQRNFPWKNKHQNVSGRVASYYDVWNLWVDSANNQTQDPIPWRPGMAGLQKGIRDAQAAGASVRALGGAWSLSEAAYTPDFMLNTAPLDVRNVGIAPENLVAGSPPGNQLFFAQCGCSVLDTHDALQAKGLALKTSGASDGQTLAGAISTGTHGSANQIGAMQDSVVGIHLLVENGKPLWIERASRPVVSERFLGLVDTPVENLIRDDDIFNAALVGFGSFGVIHAYMIEVEPLYSLVSYSRRMDYPDVADALGTLQVGSLGLPRGAELPFHFEIDVNPYKMGRGDKGAFVRFMYKQPGGSPTPAAGLPGGVRPGDDLLGVIGTLSDIAPGAIPELVTTLMASNLASHEAVTATPGYTFGPTSIRGIGMSTEMGFKLSDIRKAVEIMAGVAEDQPFGGVVAVRYVKGSSALAAFTRYDPTCTVEIQAVYSDRSRAGYEEIWKRLDAAQIEYTFHWGQVLPYEPARYRRVYGASLDRWLAAKGKVLSAAGRTLFSNPLVRGVGLE